MSGIKNDKVDIGNKLKEFSTSNTYISRQSIGIGMKFTLTLATASATFGTEVNNALEFNLTIYNVVRHKVSQNAQHKHTTNYSNSIATTNNF